MGNIDANIYEPIQGFTGVFGLTAWYDSLTPWTGVEDVTQPRPRLWLPGYVLQTYDLADCEAVRLVLVEGTETVTVALDITRVYDPARKVPGVGLFPYWHPAQGREAPEWPTLAGFDILESAVSIEIWRGAWRPLFSLEAVPQSRRVFYSVVDSSFTLGYPNRKPTGSVTIEMQAVEEIHNPAAVLWTRMAGVELPLYPETIMEKHNRRGSVEVVLSSRPIEERQPLTDY